jgi:short-subunit dehydrogenase
MSYSFDGKTALITGAASGIGAALAHKLADRGCNLALADLNGEGVTAVAQSLKSNACVVTAHILDLADASAIAALPDEIAGSHAGVDILFNNAGAALGGAFADVKPEDFEWLIDVNFYSVVRMTRAFLPALLASPDARLINVSSVFGLIGPPGQTAYAASKFAVRGFTEALRQELAQENVMVHTVFPGGVKTNIARNARINLEDMSKVEEGVKAAEANLITTPEQAAETILRGVKRGNSRILIGRDARLISLLERITPTGATRIVMKLKGSKP